MTARPPANNHGLRRDIGRLALTALVVNAILGSGIFGLPDDIVRAVGSGAPLAYLFATAGIAVVIACFAEVASRFAEAGGPYLYARAAFGRFAGVQTGWFAWLVRITSAAANANLFVVYLGQFWAGATEPGPRAAILVGLLGTLAAVNVRGVAHGARISTWLTLAKLLPLAVFLGATLLLAPGGAARLDLPDGTEPRWRAAVLALMFAFGGFEAALMPMGEARDPRRDVPFALFGGLTIVAAVYLGVHLAVAAAFPDLAAYGQPAVQERPVAEAARGLFGTGGAALIAAGVLLSTGGYLAGQFVSAPRLTFALANERDFPRSLAAVHPRFATPHASILLHAVLVATFAIYGSFLWNAILSAVARLVTYATVCGAVPRLRSLHPGASGFRVPGGPLLPVLGLLFCVVLAAEMEGAHAIIAAAVALAATANWALARRRP